MRTAGWAVACAVRDYCPGMEPHRLSQQDARRIAIRAQLLDADRPSLVAEVVDEPVAAATALGLRDGAVIDIGHGTTGVSVMNGGEVVASIDEATGGHHMTLVLAGALKMSYESAEAFKVDPGNEAIVFATIRPTLEKMATIAAEARRTAGNRGDGGAVAAGRRGRRLLGDPAR